MRTVTASATFSSSADLTRASFNLTRPAAIACWARLRVLKKRAAHSHLSRRSQCSDRTGNAGAAQPAVAAGILGEVLLVVFLGIVELRRRTDLGRDRAEAGLAERLLKLGLRGERRLHLRITIGVDRRAVLRARVVALTHALRGIVRLPEALEELVVRDDCRIKDNEHSFGVIGEAAAHLFVARILRLAARISDRGRVHARCFPEHA